MVHLILLLSVIQVTRLGLHVSVLCGQRQTEGGYTGIYEDLGRGSLDETIPQIGNPSKPQSL